MKYVGARRRSLAGCKFLQRISNSALQPLLAMQSAVLAMIDSVCSPGSRAYENKQF